MSRGSSGGAVLLRRVGCTEDLVVQGGLLAVRIGCRTFYTLFIYLPSPTVLRGLLSAVLMIGCLMEHPPCPRGHLTRNHLSSMCVPWALTRAWQFGVWMQACRLAFGLRSPCSIGGRVVLLRSTHANPCACCC